jgi:hypothetical protein
MAAEILTLHGDVKVTAEGTPQGVIDMLRQTLEEAERGEISAVAMAVITPGGTSVTRCRWKIGQGTTMLGAVVLLQADIVAAL